MPESIVLTCLELERQMNSEDPRTSNGQADFNGVEHSESSGSTSPRNSRDSSWLQVEVCRDFRRDTCPRGEQCRFAHPDAKVMGRDGKVTCCYDFLKAKCKRDFCKYYHPPPHIKERLIAAGRQFGAMMSGSPRSFPVVGCAVPGQYWDGSALKAMAPMTLAYGPMTNRLPVCQEFLMGQCHVPMCPLAHPDPHIHLNADQTVTVCHNIMRGYCGRGDRCRFYHPPSAQQPPILNGVPPSQGYPMGQAPHLLPMYLPSSPPPAAPLIPVSMQGASFLPPPPAAMVSPPPVPSTACSYVPSVPMVPVISPMLRGPVSPFLPAPPMVVAATPVSVIDSTMTSSDMPGMAPGPAAQQDMPASLFGAAGQLQQNKD